MSCDTSWSRTGGSFWPTSKNFNTKKHNSAPNVKFCDRSATQRWKSNEIALAVMATRKRGKWQSKWASSYRQHCAAFNCNNYTGSTKGLSFFTFPKDEDRCSKWVQNIRRADLVGKKASALRHYKLCGLHFESS
ncbi:hypothetical protein LSAT2_030696 [Lamellibrachia satsuma]|nr:hypothetical protein LSAT2_030696 [Lamellibrachia satsuma]